MERISINRQLRVKLKGFVSIKVLLCLLMLNVYAVSAQDTIRIAYYNLLKFDQTAVSRAASMLTIMEDMQPDLLLVCELETELGADLLLSNVFSQFKPGAYERADWVNGPDMDNMLFYNSEKFELYSQDIISTNLRNISHYRLYLKDPMLASHQDTIFMNAFVLHLKASDGASNEQQRLSQCQSLRSYIDFNTNGENILVGGDYNFYGSSEPGYGHLLNDGIFKLNDPVNAPGVWHTNPGYTDLHTQSTRTSNVGGGIGGGLDDRFDLILVSDDVLQNGNEVEMITSTYMAYGNDGNRFNQQINSLPYNPAYSVDVLDALYDASDHLPIVADFLVDVDFDATPVRNPVLMEGISVKWLQPSTSSLELSIDSELKTDMDLQIIDISGKVILHTLHELKVGAQKIFVDYPELDPGVYLLRMKVEKGNPIAYKFMLTN